MEGSGVPLLLVSVLIVAVVAVIYLLFSSKNTPKLNKEKYQGKWLSIEHSIKRDNPSSYPMAVLNADKLVDQALRECKYKGETMGERMKSAHGQWKNPNHVWGAHKIRNQLAHEADAEISYETAIRALSAFKQALKDLGAI
jgi:hypothetical protein